MDRRSFSLLGVSGYYAAGGGGDHRHLKETPSAARFVVQFSRQRIAGIS